MFIIKAGFTDKFEVNAGIEKVREFFGENRHIVEMMDGVDSIHTDGKGVTRWKIRAEVPLIFSLTVSFSVELAEKTEDRIEWIPAKSETQNYLKYSADFFEMDEDLTIVQLMQNVEIRRKSARELHPLAGLAGESLISGEMKRRVSEMVGKFIQQAQRKLETN
jgi:carbon monoxide dehydrogenase subunit G